jgi:predicted O-methyltransferase YrrM
MNVVRYLTYTIRLARIRPERYRNLFRAIVQTRARTIVEVGTWNGMHARQMIETAAIHHPMRDIRYMGFDLFEDLTDELFQAELSKRPPKMADVQARLALTGAHVQLFKGNTRETIPQAVAQLREADLFYVDGGHSIETIRSDWEAIERALKPGAVVIFDDYYVNDPSEVEGLGCQSIIDALDRSRYDVELLDPVNEFRKDWGTLKIRFAKVRKR